MRGGVCEAQGFEHVCASIAHIAKTPNICLRCVCEKASPQELLREKYVICWYIEAVKYLLTHRVLDANKTEVEYRNPHCNFSCV